MYPMDLEEYLLAKNENNLINLIKNSYDKNVHLDSLVKVNLKMHFFAHLKMFFLEPPLHKLICL